MTKKPYIEELITKINKSPEFFVIAKEAGYLIVGTVMKLQVRVENSNNLFQPFGKNIAKHLPIYFPVIIDMQKANSSDMVYGFNEFEIPLLHLNKSQIGNLEGLWLEGKIKMDTLNIEVILRQYINENFRK
jgi:hypothetical protein